MPIPCPFSGVGSGQCSDVSMLRLAHPRITSSGDVPGTHETFQHTKYTPSVDIAVMLHVTVYECPFALLLYTHTPVHLSDLVYMCSNRIPSTVHWELAIQTVMNLYSLCVYTRTGHWCVKC